MPLEFPSSRRVHAYSSKEVEWVFEIDDALSVWERPIRHDNLQGDLSKTKVGQQA